MAVKKVGEIRCSGCNKLLAKGSINDGTISLKCKCGKETVITAAMKKVEARPFQDRMNIQRKDESLSFKITHIPDGQ